MMESFAEAIGKVAVIGFEGVGKGVAFGFEDEAYSPIVVENLVPLVPRKTLILNESAFFLLQNFEHYAKAQNFYIFAT